MLFRPHVASSRQIRQGQKIHSSLLFATGKLADSYKPPPPPPQDIHWFWGVDGFWERLHSTAVVTWEEDPIHQWLELDLYDYIEGVVAAMVKPDDEKMRQLRQIALTSVYTLSCVLPCS